MSHDHICTLSYIRDDVTFSTVHMWWCDTVGEAEEVVLTDKVQMWWWDISTVNIWFYYYFSDTVGGAEEGVRKDKVHMWWCDISTVHIWWCDTVGGAEEGVRKDEGCSSTYVIMWHEWVMTLHEYIWQVLARTKDAAAAVRALKGTNSVKSHLWWMNMVIIHCSCGSSRAERNKSVKSCLQWLHIVNILGH